MEINRAISICFPWHILHLMEVKAFFSRERLCWGALMARALLLIKEAESCEYCRLKIHTQTLPGGLFSSSAMVNSTTHCSFYLQGWDQLGILGTAALHLLPTAQNLSGLAGTGIKDKNQCWQMFQEMPIGWAGWACPRRMENMNTIQVPALFKVRNYIKLRQISPVQFSSLPSAAHPNL